MSDWVADDGLPLGYDSDEDGNVNSVQKARAARIKAARNQASSYSAKIDEPNVSHRTPHRTPSLRTPRHGKADPIHAPPHSGSATPPPISPTKFPPASACT